MATVHVDDQFDLYGGFVSEIEGYLPVIAANIRQLLTTPGDEALLEESHRFAHTIKSSSAMMGMPELRRVAAPMEAHLARAYAGDIGVDEALVLTVEGTLARVRSFLTVHNTGGDPSGLVQENDQAYAVLRTQAPKRQTPAGEDAADRLDHSDYRPAPDDNITNVSATTGNSDGGAVLSPPGDRPDTALQPVEERTDPVSTGALTLPAAAPLRPAPHVDEVTDVAVDRPRLTILPGGPSHGQGAGGLTGSHSIAAEWLAEILGGPPEAPVDGHSLAAEDLPMLLGSASAGEVASDDRNTANQEWARHVADERALLDAQRERESEVLRAQLDAERQAHADQMQALRLAHAQERHDDVAEHERALQEQRAELEREVQHYLDDELRPQLEDEIRQDLTHEFQVAALLDPDLATVGRPPSPTVAVSAVIEDADLAAEMQEIFAQEAAEHIQAIGELALALRNQPENLEHLRSLRRSVHTLKGAAATVGLPAISNLCHQVESALDRRLDDGVIAGGSNQSFLLLESCNALEALVRGDQGAIGQASALAERLSVLTGVPLPPLAPATIESADDHLATNDVAGEPSTLPAWPGDQGANPLAEATTSASLNLRVSLAELDHLLATNHELIITQSALDVRVQHLQQILTDLHHTADRLRAAGNRLGSVGGSAPLLVAAAAPGSPSMAIPAFSAAQTWREALQRQAGATEPGGEFDALELDRYTDFQRLTREVTEAALDVATGDVELGAVLDDFRLTLKQQQRLHTSQYEVLLHTRMVPLRIVLPRLARAVQAIAAQQSKQVNFLAEGQDTLVDRAVLEEVADALLHLVRNAIDHGIEQPEERLAAGKAACGTIHLKARRSGPEIVIELDDDGRGLDSGSILQAAIARGLIGDAARLTEHDIQQLVFSPGLSTAVVITDISGRGVGLDVVRANLQSLRGQVDLVSRFGTGTTFTLRVPISLALLTVSLVEAGGHTYAIPLTLVRHVEKVTARRLKLEEGGQIVHHGGRTYPVVDLTTLLGLPSARASGRSTARPLVFVNTPEGTVAVVVDYLVGKREVVVKGLGRQLQGIRGVHGATALGNGVLALILDLPALLKLEAGVPRAAVTTVPVRARQRQLLVVDDSPSVRRLTAAVFERQGWQVRPARDGIEALEALGDWQPDAVIMDIEMPRMDGFELLAVLRHQPETATLPAVMVTSRGGEKHREKAVRLGVDAYLIKPFREEELLAAVTGLVGQSSATTPASTR